jgi:hypothetical protein
VLIPKLINDFAGHYNRPDVFSLHVNTAPPVLVQQHGAVPAFQPLQQPGASDGFLLSDSASGTAQIGHLMPPKQLTRKEKK